MNVRRLLPAILRARPEATLELRYTTPVPSLPSSSLQIVEDALRAAGVHADPADPTGDGAWSLLIPWRTLVYGIIRRDVEESARLILRHGSEGWELVLLCEPRATHGAHAAGAAGVLVMAILVWLVGGWRNGLLPAVTTILAGGLWTEASRIMALGVLERRLRQLLVDLGTALFPSAPARILPPPQRMV
jgi:hypothetical protein